MSDTRACPYCAETIRFAGTICRFCNRNVSEFASPVRVLSPSELDRPTPSSINWPGAALVLALALGVTLVFLITMFATRTPAPPAPHAAQQVYTVTRAAGAAQPAKDKLWQSTFNPLFIPLFNPLQCEVFYRCQRVGFEVEPRR